MMLLQQSEATAAQRRIPVYLVDVTDGFTPETGLTPSVTVSKNGAAYAAGGGAITEVATGLYFYEATAAELDTLGYFNVRVVDAASRDFQGIAQVVAWDPYTSIPDQVWDELLTGAAHNIATSAGRRLRQVQEEQGYEGGAVYLDTVNGVAGTTPFENGTVGNPVSTLADALTIANDATVNLKTIKVRPGSSITLVAALDGFIIEGDLWTLALGGQSISGSRIIGATVSGIGTGAVAPNLTRCQVGAVTLPPSTLEGCCFTATLTIGSAGDFFLDQCFSAIAGTATPTLDFAAVGATNVNLRHYSGGIEIENMAAGDTMSVEGHGQVIINANCSGGTLAIRGEFDLTDNSGGAVTLSDDARLTKSDIADDVWDEVASGHNTLGTFGYDLQSVRKLLTNDLVVDEIAQTMFVREDDSIATFLTFAAKDGSGGVFRVSNVNVPVNRDKGV